jgi:CIC family chloride channel protein
MSGQEVLLRCRELDRKHVYPVVDAERRLLGIVTPDELALLAGSSELVPLTTAFDLMREPVSVQADAELGVAIETMLSSGLRELPVVDAAGRVLGCVDDRSISHAYQRSAANGS